MTTLINKSYLELVTLKTFDERLSYLKTNSGIGIETFGYDRYINQMFYSSKEWSDLRREVIIRDNGCDLGIPELEINGKIFIHHINPLSKDDILYGSEKLFDMNNLITVSFDTHNKIHYGTRKTIDLPEQRYLNDTCPWR